MDSTTSILLYSKFSNACKSLLAMLHDSNLDTYFQHLCIDNKEIRSLVKASKKFNIKSVPCILNIDRLSGVAGQYEGQKAFELVSSMIPENRGTTQIQEVEEVEEVPVLVEEPVQEPTVPKQTHSLADLGRGAVIKSKISASQVMASQGITTAPNHALNNSLNQNVTSIENLENMSPQPAMPSPIETKKTGKPINVSEIMAQARSSGIN
jgi:hypothetical protein